MSNGDPELVQLLTPEGERVDHPDYAFDGDDEKINGFYRDMVLTRRIDAEATALQRQGELGLWASCLGQEAAQVGSGRAMRDRTSSSRPTASTASPGASASTRCSCSALFRGVDLGGWDAAKTRFHLYTIVIGAQTLHATGYAMGIERDGLVGTGDPDRDAAVIAYFGDGATSQGDVNEAFIFASSYNAPIVFFCQNNQWAISEPIERQSRIPLVPAGGRLRLPRRTGRRQRRAGRARRHRRRRWSGPAPATARPSSRPTRTGWARTPPPTTRPSTGWPTSSSTGGSRTRSSGCGPT